MCLAAKQNPQKQDKTYIEQPDACRERGRPQAFTIPFKCGLNIFRLSCTCLFEDPARVIPKTAKIVPIASVLGIEYSGLELWG